LLEKISNVEGFGRGFGIRIVTAVVVTDSGSGSLFFVRRAVSLRRKL
jgi:hypothetical protein